MTAANQSETHIKRLNELATSWDKQSPLVSCDKFTPADLRLMLECFAPLQDIIRQIANGSAVSQPKTVSVQTNSFEANIAPEPQLQRQLEEANAELARLQTRIREDAAKIKKATDDIAKQNTEIATLLDNKNELKQQLLSAQQQTEELQQEIGGLHKQLVHFQPPTELQTLRKDTALAHNLGLDLPANDQQALIAMVAVLSQKDNLERLWDNLKERCEAEKRPVNTEELSLLTSALGWYNHNWKLRPFQLLQPHEGDSFNFEQQQKARHQTDGESLSQIWLPGLADGAGKPLRKTLILTR
ncbi:hypothetical protein LL240_09805 [Oceanimonas baumannii]|uniref:hypothetical protein n=1 Tax=Oceanimonas baumannii TaxID=129578 RepID=UPI001D187566|nr:hypothetical protein [Oceanimonas baumannii]MCC4264749.1 hypothetical protein [Oceanimonas baumannii]